MNCLSLTWRSKQSKSNLACLAQSVEHAAVNRSVGGPSPSTGAKRTTQNEWFFCCIHRDWTPTPLVYGFAVDTAFRSGRSQARYFTVAEPSTGAKTNHSKRVVFLLLLCNRTPVALPLCYAYDTALHSGRSVYLCVHTHCLSLKVHTCKPWVDTLQSASWLYVMLLFYII